MKIKFHTGRIFVTIGVLLYILVLNLTYVFSISPAFTYLGYIAKPLSTTAITLMIILGLLPSFWLPLTAQRPSNAVCWLLYIFVCIPIVIVPFYTLQLSWPC